jgi:hypothetical protein
VKISAAELLTNIGQMIPKGQLIYIATDERNKTFFEPLRKRFPKVISLFPSILWGSLSFSFLSIFGLRDLLSG